MESQLLEPQLLEPERQRLGEVTSGRFGSQGGQKRQRGQSKGSEGQTREKMETTQIRSVSSCERSSSSEGLADVISISDSPAELVAEERLAPSKDVATCPNPPAIWEETAKMLV